MNIIFMGTPVFAVPCLEALIKAGHNIQCVFSQPDKPKDRGQKLQNTPVKECALSHNLEVFQPTSLRTGADGEKSLELIKKYIPDCIIVVAFGQILPREILKIPLYGCINVHASLLPRYRGASPINYCIINGEKESGVSIQYMAEGIDVGDVIFQEKYDITEDMTATRLHDELMEIGARLLLKTIPALENETAPRNPQDGENSCKAPMLTKQMCRIDWEKPAHEIYNLIRGLAEKPAAFTFLNEKRLKIYFSCIKETGDIGDLKAGAVIDAENFTVLCGDGKALMLTDIQLEGNRRMDAETFLRGRKIEKGTVLR